ncbi:ABC-2 type transporter domain-containing protein [Phthorimaea operculella]|nr:ABC-2 type transporter domain-containing protein [Phthorimaea operculella]
MNPGMRFFNRLLQVSGLCHSCVSDHILVGFLIGALYYDIGDDGSKVLSNLGFQFFNMLFLMYTSMTITILSCEYITCLRRNQSQKASPFPLRCVREKQRMTLQFKLVIQGVTITSRKEVLRLFAHILVGFLIGALYYDIGDDGSKVLSNLGFLFFNMLFLMYTSMTITILSYLVGFLVGALYYDIGDDGSKVLSNLGFQFFNMLFLMYTSMTITILSCLCHSCVSDHILVGFLIGALYYDIGDDGSKVLSNLGFQFFNMLFLMYTSMTITILSCEYITCLRRNQSQKASPFPLRCVREKQRMTLQFKLVIQGVTITSRKEVLRLFAHILVGFLIGALYYDIGDDGSKVLSNLGFQFFNMLFLMYTSMTITILSYLVGFLVGALYYDIGDDGSKVLSNLGFLFFNMLFLMYTSMTITILSYLVGFLIGALYYDIGDDGSKVLSNLGFQFFNMLFLMYTSMTITILSFPLEMPVLLKEHFNRWYSLRAYYLAITVSDIPFQAIFCIIYVVIVYLLTSQPLVWFRFAMFLSSCLLISFVAQSVGLVVGAAMNVQTGRWLVAGWSLAGRWLVAGWSLAGRWLVAGWSLAGRWLVAGWSLAGRWLVAGWSLAGRWLVKCRLDNVDEISPQCSNSCIIYVVIVYLLTSQPLVWFRFAMFLSSCLLISFVAQSVGLVVGAAMNVQCSYNSCIIYVVIVYLLTSQPLVWFRFAMFLSSCLLISFVAQSVGLVVGAAMNVQNGVFLAPVMSVPFLLFSGFFVSFNAIPVYLRWITYLSYIRYGFEGTALATYSFDRPKLQCHQVSDG